VGTATLVIAITLWIFAVPSFLYSPMIYASNPDGGTQFFAIGIIFGIIGILLMKKYDKDRKKEKSEKS